MKKLLVFLAEGFEELEALTIVDYFRRAGGEAVLAAVGPELLVRSSHDVKVQADASLRQLDPNDFDAIYIPGGLPGATHLAGDPQVRAWVSQFNSEEKLIAAICAGPAVLDRLNLLKAGQFTCYPGFEDHLETEGRVDEALVKDGHIWTAMGPRYASHLAFAMVEELLGREALRELEEGLLY